MKKKVLLIAPSHFEIYKTLVKNLEALKYSIEFLMINDGEFKYKNNKDRLINLFRKIFLNDKNYKKKVLANRYKIQDFNNALSKFEKDSFDYSLIIRADLCPLEIIHHINLIAKKTIAYQWDGIQRYPEIFERIPLFHKFYVFQKSDYKEFKTKFSNLNLTQNFYPTIEPNYKTKPCDVFYIGTYNGERFDSFISIYNQLKQFDLNFNILISSSDQVAIEKYKNNDIHFFSDPIMYDENLALIKDAKIVLDVKVHHHSGLSFRFFEAIKYEVKMITDNKSILEYDFYNPNNIYILNYENPVKLKDFIYSDYEKLDSNIYEKYSFDTWIKELLE